MKQVHLVCNAHLDPVWQWEWDEGLAEALSTFRIAADFCTEYEGFVFNHNEALLYQWVEEYDPLLFARIQKLVADGKWHIMGGWYLQPDVIMSSGESIVRQIIAGRAYFLKKFGVVPTTAMNVDSFGHDRGMVQILKKCGYDSYLVGRPPKKLCGVPAKDFNWQGFDGSSVKVHLSEEGYNSNYGHAVEKIKKLMEENQERNPVLVLWGIGNHGGGPSRIDLEQIGNLQKELADTCELIHSTPESYFGELPAESLPDFQEDLVPIMVGCYTSQVRIKQMHRKLENELYQTEKLAVAAESQKNAAINWNAIQEAEQTLRFNEFHDILPGSAVERAEEAALQAMGGALDQLKKQKVKAFVSMIKDHTPSAPGVFPIFVYNPHPWKIQRAVECEFQLADQNFDFTMTDFDAFCNGKQIPAQLIKEDSSIPLDWRKRMIFQLELEPFSTALIECHPKTLPGKKLVIQPEGETIRLENEDTLVEISKKTGLLNRYQIDGTDLLRKNSFRLAVVSDDEDPWGMRGSRFKEPSEYFRLATPEEAGRIADQDHSMTPVRILEDGSVTTEIEAIFVYGHSFAVVRYHFLRFSRELQIDLELMWQEPSKMVKMELPAAFQNGSCLGDGMFSYRPLRRDGTENAAQKWLGVRNGSEMFVLYNQGTYGSSFENGVLSQTLLRSPAYCAHPIDDRQILPEDRYFTRIDCGCRRFHFVLEGGREQKMLQQVQQKAEIIGQPPMMMCFFAHGDQGIPGSFLSVDSPSITVSALKKEFMGENYILRLYHSADNEDKVHLSIPDWSIEQEVTFGPFEVKTLRYAEGVLKEIPMDEVQR